MYMLPWKCEAPEQGFEKCNFGHLSGLANCSSELRVPFLGDPHHKIYVVVVRRQVFKTATLAGGLSDLAEWRALACAMDMDPHTPAYQVSGILLHFKFFIRDRKTHSLKLPLLISF